MRETPCRSSTRPADSGCGRGRNAASRHLAHPRNPMSETAPCRGGDAHRTRNPIAAGRRNRQDILVSGRGSASHLTHHPIVASRRNRATPVGYAKILPADTRANSPASSTWDNTEWAATKLAQRDWAHTNSNQNRRNHRFSHASLFFRDHCTQRAKSPFGSNPHTDICRPHCLMKLARLRDWLHGKWQSVSLPWPDSHIKLTFSKYILECHEYRPEPSANGKRFRASVCRHHLAPSSGLMAASYRRLDYFTLIVMTAVLLAALYSAVALAAALTVTLYVPLPRPFLTVILPVFLLIENLALDLFTLAIE